MEPLTGRKHQLRVHCAGVLSSPILGDPRYGTACPPSAAHLSPLLHLHARLVVMPHPIIEGEELRAVAELPAHMAQTWRTLGWGDHHQLHE